MLPLVPVAGGLAATAAAAAIVAFKKYWSQRPEPDPEGQTGSAVGDTDASSRAKLDEGWRRLNASRQKFKLQQQRDRSEMEAAISTSIVGSLTGVEKQLTELRETAAELRNKATELREKVDAAEASKRWWKVAGIGLSVLMALPAVAWNAGKLIGWI